MSDWSVYLLRCGDGSIYTGIATDVKRRVNEHESGTRGAKYLRGRGPLQLLFQRVVGDQAVATRIELRIKQLPRSEKEDQRRLDDLIAQVLNEDANKEQANKEESAGQKVATRP